MLSAKGVMLQACLRSSDCSDGVLSIVHDRRANKVVLPINNLFVMVADKEIHAQQGQMLDRMSLSIAKTFMDAEAQY